MLKSIIDNPEVLAALIFCFGAGFGQLLHAIKKWSDGAVDSPIFWLTVDKRRTVGALIGNGAGMLIFIQTGVLGPIMVQPNGWWALFLFGFMNGFAADSALNKATKSADPKP
jgi:hypothetical protein